MPSGLLSTNRLSRLLAAIAVAILVPVSPAVAATFTVTTTDDTGAGSLRQAIADANTLGSNNTIAFAIPGAGPHVIAPASALPGIAHDGTTIDACTQPGSDCSGLPLTLRVQLHGQGFSLAGFGFTVRGFSFTGPSAAVTVNRVSRDSTFQIQDDVTIEHNYVGLAPDGSAAGKSQSFNFQPGLRSLATPLERLRIVGNVIGSNTGPGIPLSAQPFGSSKAIEGARIAGNVIGLDPTRTQPRPNSGDGILFDTSSGLEIAGNRIAGNGGVGIRHRGRAQAVRGTDPAIDPGLLIEGNVVESNAAGGIVLEPDPPGPAVADAYGGPVNVLGNTVRDNGAAGIAVTAAAETLRPNLRVGGLAPGEPNTISGNAGPGVAIGADTSDTSIAVTVRGNSIFANGGPAIDLASDGPTENGEPLETRGGPNLLVNHPVIDSVAHGSVIVNGSYAGAANATYTLDFYASETTDGPQTWIGSAPVATDATGTAAYSATFAGDLPAGWLVSATATDADGNTSEFAATAAVVQLPALPEEPPTEPGPPVGEPSQGPPRDEPSPAPPAGQPPTGDDAERPSGRRGPKVRLRVSQTASRRTLRAGATATFTIRVRNPSRRVARKVRTCAALPAGLVQVRAVPRARLSNGRHCWTAAKLGAKGSRTYRLTVRALAGARGARLGRVVTSSPDTRTARSTRRVRVLPAKPLGGGVTG